MPSLTKGRLLKNRSHTKRFSARRSAPSLSLEVRQTLPGGEKKRHMKKRIKAVIFDYGLTIGCEYYFNKPHPEITNWSELIQEIAFRDTGFSEKWMKGELRTQDIAEEISNRTSVSCAEIEEFLRIGCQSIKENAEVVAFARYLKKNHFPIAMVTVNFDIFNEVIIPFHGYAEVFPVIVNSCDFGTFDKSSLWPIAFSKMNPVVNYDDCLLIEDKESEIDKFIGHGGQAIHYTGER